jgi:hypothetical protein
MVSATIPTPVEFVKSIADLPFPPKVNERLQELMDRNSEGTLTADERAQLEALVELSETLSILRGKAILLLRRGA